MSCTSLFQVRNLSASFWAYHHWTLISLSKGENKLSRAHQRPAENLGTPATAAATVSLRDIFEGSGEPRVRFDGSVEPRTLVGFLGDSPFFGLFQSPIYEG